MKRITFFIGTLLEGGAERVVSTLSNKLSQNGYGVEILKYYNSENFYELEQNIVVKSVEELSGTTNIIKNLKYIKDCFNDTDIIVSFLAPFNMLALFVNKNKKPIIVADRNDPRRIPDKLALRTIRNYLYQKYADAIVLQTRSNLGYFNKKIQKKSFIIPNPVFMSNYAGKGLKTKKTNTIVSVGRLMPQKNHILLIEAFNRLLEKQNDYKLVIYGEGPYRPQLEAKIAELRLTDKVFLPGKQKDIFGKISDAILFVLSSDYEGMPNALIEAMCLGLPVISTRVSGANELIQEGINGCLVDRNIDDLYNKMDLVLKDDELRNRISNNALKLNDELNVDSIVAKWIEMFEKYLNV